ncbi:MAG TPA: protoporphyrinogen oxidase [Vicinamibacterales bacterium]|jgi:oxygen-dependent protoporphyrinogen oxidase|nr:protoporphyrinogen oxidase [Vicinamibacterales bacterium]
MNSATPPNRFGADARVVIVGGGIAGLAVARAIRDQAPGAEVIVLESHDRVGGNVRTERIDGYVCEAGPDGFLDNAPATLEFIEQIGLTRQLLPSRDEARRRFIFRRDRLHEVPLSPSAFLFSPLLSPLAKLRILCEPLSARAPGHDETIQQFAERHMGREAAGILIGSMVSGIFAGDAQELSLRACFPKMHQMDSEFGSLFRAMLARRRERRSGSGVGAPAGRLTSFADGMESLVRAAAASLGPIVRPNRRVVELRARGNAARPEGPRLVGARAFSVINGTAIEADAVVLAGSASESADLLRPFEPTAAGLLATIPTAPLAVVCLGYDERALAADRGPLNGFGFLVPRSEGPRILGALWETSIYAGRAPEGKALVRVMIGGATDREAVDLDDTALLSAVGDDLRRTMGVRVAPEFVQIFRHRRGIPQYTLGHDKRLARIEARLREHPGLFLAGNSYRGVSINACIEEAPAVARRVAAHLQTLPRSLAFAAAR